MCVVCFHTTKPKFIKTNQPEWSLHWRPRPHLPAHHTTNWYNYSSAAADLTFLCLCLFWTCTTLLCNADSLCSNIWLWWNSVIVWMVTSNRACLLRIAFKCSSVAATTAVAVSAAPDDDDDDSLSRRSNLLTSSGYNKTKRNIYS